MTKVSFNDITPPEGGAPAERTGQSTGQAGSIRDINLESGDRRERREKRAERRMPEEQTHAPGSGYAPSRKRGSFLMWASAFIILAGLVVVSTFMFIGKTTVNLTARVAHLTLSENVVHSAYSNPSEGELGFTVLEESTEMSETIAATETKFVEQKASGKITVYNDFSTSNQRLIKNTRFETPDGKIYRVRNSFTVPGRTGAGPGSVEVTVYADKAGEEYNKENVKFTVPAFKETGDLERFDKFWAETATTLSGGFSGKRPTVSDTDLASTREKLRASLGAELKQKLLTKAGEDKHLFDDSIFFTYESTEGPAADASESVVVTERATARAAVFSANAFAEELSKDSGVVFHDGAKTLTNPDSVTFAIVQKEKVDPAVDEIIQFTAGGDAKFIWDIHITELKNELSGKSSSVLDSILAGYPGVKDAYVTIRPFWRDAFPHNTNDIEVSVETEQ